MPSSDLTLYAQWTIGSYNVAFDADGGTSVSSQTLSYGSLVTQPSDPTKTGSTFGGWYSDSGLTTLWDFDSDTVEESDLTIYAKWISIPYTISFESNSGTAVESQVEEYGTLASEPTAPTRTGYTFSGWFTDSGLTNEWDFSTDTVGASDFTLYADWTINNYMVSFESNGGSAVSGESVTYGTLVTEPNEPTRTGYTFSGWFADENLTSSWDFSADTMGPADVTLYAGWTINTYTVSYDSNGGSSISDETLEYNDLVTQPSAPTKAGYTFSGWYADESLTSVWNFDSDSVGTSDFTLYAKWNMIVDADLTSLEVDGYELDESFDPDTVYYTVNDVVEDNVDIQAYVTSDQYSRVEVNGSEITPSDWINLDLENGANTINIIVTAQDGTTTKNYTLIINKLSDVALLESMEVEGLILTPSFESAHTSYSTHTTSGSSIYVTLTPEDEDSSIYYDGNLVTSGGAITLTSDGDIELPISVGLNAFEFDVVAHNGVDTNTYSLTVDRDNDDERLEAIAVSGYALSPDFSRNRMSYDLTVVEDSAEITVTMTDYSEITIDSVEVESGEALTVGLQVGDNEIEIDTIAEDGLHTATYTLNIYRKNDDPNLEELSIEENIVGFVFNASVYTYAFDVYKETVLTLIPEITDYYKIMVNDEDVETDEEVEIQLEVGINTITIDTTAEDEVHTASYELLVNKAQDTAELTGIDIKGIKTNAPLDLSQDTFALGTTYTGVVQFAATWNESTNQSLKINDVELDNGEYTSINLALGLNQIEIVATAEDTVTERKYTFTIVRKKVKDDEPDVITETPTESEPEDDGAIVIVNGKEERAGEMSIKTENGQRVAEVIVNREAIEQKIEDASNSNDQVENKIIIPVSSGGSDTISAKLTGDIVKAMEDSAFELSVDADDVEYIIPAKEVNIQRVAELMNVNASSLEEIEVDIKIEKIDSGQADVIINNAESKSFEVVFPPVEFTITARARRDDGQEEVVEVDSFSSYVERSVEIPSDIDPSKITTGVLYNADGTFSHIPTRVVEVNGRYFAQMNSVTNSSYSVIWNPIEIESAKGHWSEETVTNLASRLIIDSDVDFNPDEAITRGAFIEYIVKGLGLYKTNVASQLLFTDMNAENADVLTVASQYGIVSGYPDGSFKPDAHLTREEAMMILCNALKVLPEIASDDENGFHFEDSGELSPWSYDAAKEITSKNIMVGTPKATIDPKGTLTCAQAAAIVENLLVESDLINE